MDGKNGEMGVHCEMSDACNKKNFFFLLNTQRRSAREMQAVPHCPSSEMQEQMNIRQSFISSLFSL